MRHRNTFLTVIILIIISFLSSCNTVGKKRTTEDKGPLDSSNSSNFILDILKDETKFGGKTLAIIGDRKISINKFKWFMQRERSQDLEKMTSEEKKKCLDDMIDNEVMLVAALKKDLDKDKEIIDKAKEKLRDLAINWMFKVYVTDKIKVSDEEINRRIKTGRRKKETIEKAKKRIHREIFNNKKKELDNIWTSKCYEETNVKYNDKNLESFAIIWTKTKNKVRKDKPRFPFIQRRYFNLSKLEKEKVVATFNGGKIGMQDLIKELMDIIPPKRPAPSLISTKKLAEYALIRPVLGKKAFDENWHETKEVRAVLAGKVKGWLINKIRKIEVWDKVKDLKLTDEEIKDSIEPEMQEKKIEEALENWKKNLKKKIPIKVDKDLLREVLLSFSQTPFYA